MHNAQRLAPDYREVVRAGHETKASGTGGGTFLSKGRTLYQLVAGVLDGSRALRAVDATRVGSANVSQNVK